MVGTKSPAAGGASYLVKAKEPTPSQSSADLDDGEPRRCIGFQRESIPAPGLEREQEVVLGRRRQSKGASTRASNPERR